MHLIITFMPLLCVKIIHFPLMFDFMRQALPSSTCKQPLNKFYWYIKNCYQKCIVCLPGICSAAHGLVIWFSLIF